MRLPPMTVVRRLLGGLTIASLLFVAIELSARLVERRLESVAPLDYERGRDSLLVDESTGLLRRPFLVVRPDGFEIRPDYTNGDECYPIHCQALPIQKGPREFRMACFGGSTTAGLDLLSSERPVLGYDARKGAWPGPEPFCALLQRRLQAVMPDRAVTAYNLGGDALDSEKILPIMREIAERVPFDLWVVYMGHNEYLFAPDLVGLRLPSAPLAWLAHEANLRLAVFRLMARGYRRLASDSSNRGRTREYAPEVYVRSAHYESARARVAALYEKRLKEIVTLTRSAGIQLVFSELVANHVWGGDGSDALFQCYQRGVTEEMIERIHSRYVRARELEASLSLPTALAAYRDIEAIDSGFQPAIAGEARCLAALGRRRAALEASYRAQEQVALPAVITPELTRILEDVCRKTHTPLAQTIPVFDDIFINEPDRYARLFLDDCHPTEEGHAIIADRIMAALTRAGIRENSEGRDGTSLPTREASPDVL